MDRNEEDTTTEYSVVVNREQQYSIWRADREIPKGWSSVGKNGNKADCLAHIRQIWTDMRPLSLRNRMSSE
jgi:MbtH protein